MHAIKLTEPCALYSINNSMNLYICDLPHDSFGGTLCIVIYATSAKRNKRNKVQTWKIDCGKIDMADRVALADFKNTFFVAVRRISAEISTSVTWPVTSRNGFFGKQNVANVKSMANTKISLLHSSRNGYDRYLKISGCLDHPRIIHLHTFLFSTTYQTRSNEVTKWPLAKYWLFISLEFTT